MIARCSGDLVPEAEVPEYIRRGLLKDRDDYFQAKRDALQYLGHECRSRRCLRRTGPGENDFECRVPDIYHSSPNPTKHTYVKHSLKHTPEAWAIYENVRLARRNHLHCTYDANSSLLECVEHYPPSLWEGKKFSPCHRELFLALRGNQNLQIVHRHHNTKYLIKYVVKIDENNRVFIGVDRKNDNKFQLEQHFLHNTKIDSSRRHEETVMKKRRQHRYSATSKTFMEMEHTLLGIEMARTNVEFVHISTKPLEERIGMKKESQIQEINARRKKGTSLWLKTQMTSMWRRLMHSV